MGAVVVCEKTSALFLRNVSQVKIFRLIVDLIIKYISIINLDILNHFKSRLSKDNYSEKLHILFIKT